MPSISKAVFPFALLAAAVPAMAPAAPAAPAATPAKALTEDTRAGLRCAAAFAIAATEQRRGERAALALPPLSVRGKEYFVRVSAKAMDEAALDRETVSKLLVAQVADLQGGAAGDPDWRMAAEVKACLPRLDAEVPPLPKPTLAQCAAILAIAYEEVYARAGLDAPEARDLKTLAAVLDARQRKALQLQALPGQEIDKRMSEAHDAMLAEAVGQGPGVEKYDLQTCYDFAKPDEKTHY